jgi:diguanylate cyclase (GGDEF)-like protein
MSSETQRTILSRAASLTAIRDIDTFEISLVKTLAEILTLNDASIYHIDSASESCRSIRYKAEVKPSPDNQQAYEAAEPHIKNTVIPGALRLGKDWIQSTGKAYTAKIDNDFLNIRPIEGSEGIAGYLSITTNRELSTADNFVISNLLAIYHNFLSLLKENHTDKLTGLLNRKTFDENIEKIHNLLDPNPVVTTYSGEEQRTEKGCEEYWLAIIDIDFFKKVNDTFGHVYGDEVLLLLSQLMTRTFRPTDLLFRFGGEEFVVIVKVTNRDSAEQGFERFRKAVEEFAFPQVGKVTISLGATQIIERYAIASAIVGQADKALYHAKENGRNALFFYEELIASGALEENSQDGELEFF